MLDRLSREDAPSELSSIPSRYATIALFNVESLGASWRDHAVEVDAACGGSLGTEALQELPPSAADIEHRLTAAQQRCMGRCRSRMTSSEPEDVFKGRMILAWATTRASCR